MLTSCSKLAPEGVNFSRGGPSGNWRPPRMLTSCSKLAPEGVNFSRGGPSGNCLLLRSLYAFSVQGFA
jgi:hypothetical protein